MELIGLHQSPLQGAAPKTGLIAAVLQMSGFFFKRREGEGKKKKHKTSFTKRQSRNKSPAVGLERKQCGLMSRDSLIVFFCAIFKKFLS